MSTSIWRFQLHIFHVWEAKSNKFNLDMMLESSKTADVNKLQDWPVKQCDEAADECRFFTVCKRNVFVK